MKEIILLMQDHMSRIGKSMWAKGRSVISKGEDCDCSWTWSNKTWDWVVMVAQLCECGRDHYTIASNR